MLWNSMLRASVATGDQWVFTSALSHKAYIMGAPLYSYMMTSMISDKLHTTSSANPLMLSGNFAEMSPFEKWGASTLRCVDQHENIIKINSLEPIKYESDLMVGVVLLRLKDDTNKTVNWSNRPTFEIQFQGRVKETCPPNIFLGCELAEPIQLGFLRKLLLSALMTLGTTLYPFIHVSLGQVAQATGMHESAHIMFPLFRIIDQFVETKPTEIPPILGQSLNESAIAKTERMSSNDFQLKRDCTYSFSFESKYLDFALWNVCNIPGLGPKSFTDFFGSQPIKIVAYDLIEERESGANPKGVGADGGLLSLFVPHGLHYNSLKKYLLHIKMTHISVIENEGEGPGLA